MGFDPLKFLEHRARPATVKEAAQAKFDKATPTRNEIQKTRRHLDRLVDQGHVKRHDGTKGGANGEGAATYEAIPLGAEPGGMT